MWTVTNMLVVFGIIFLIEHVIEVAKEMKEDLEEEA